MSREVVAPIVIGVRANARCGVQRSSRMGPVAATAPLGNEMTTVRPWPGASRGLEKSVAVLPAVPAAAHGEELCSGPAKHATALVATGVVTATDGRRMGTDHSVPMAFQ